MENGPFVDDFPIKTSIYEGFSMAMLNNQMVFCFFLGIWGFFLFDEAIFFLPGEISRLSSDGQTRV